MAILQVEHGLLVAGDCGQAAASEGYKPGMFNDLQSAYAAWAGPGDVLCSAQPDAAKSWEIILDQVASAGGGELSVTQERLKRRVNEIGISFRLAGESEERAWPLSPVPLLIEEAEWQGIAAAIIQRATLAEHVIADIYGAQSLVQQGILPASVITGSPHYLSPMVGISPAGKHYLHVYAADLARGPDGNWRVLADHTRSPAGAGYALENRLASAHVVSGLADRLNILRLAPFFADLRSGIAASCARIDPRIALLTPGRFNQSYAEQAHLARYLGLLLVEGGDLMVADGRLFLRTVEGLKRVDALWQRMDARLLDPLALDARSTIGVAELVDAIAAGGVVCANFPGAAILEAPLYNAFMPGLADHLLGEPLLMPNIATWWCGGDAERAHVTAHLNDLVLGSAFGPVPLGLTSGGDLFGDLARRPIDYIAQEIVHLSTMPVAEGGHLVPRPFTVRVFAARRHDGSWTVMPGGFARIGAADDIRATSIGAGTMSADVIINGALPVAPVTLLRDDNMVEIRRNPGTLPSRVADNLFWLGRYLERGEAVLALIRAGSGSSVVSDAGPAISPATAARIRTRLTEERAVSTDTGISFADSLAAALDDRMMPASVVSLLAKARSLGEISRERIAPDFWGLLDAPFPAPGLFHWRCVALRERFAAFAGLAADHMGRTASWRFHDLGRRIERALAVCRLLAAFADDQASADDLQILLELCDVQITYRQRYSTGLSLLAVRDLVGLDPFNPRSIRFQVTAICDHLAALPRLRDDGMAELHEATAISLSARLATHSAQTLNGWACVEIEHSLLSLSTAISDRFFLQSGQRVRAPAMTLA
ncbi:MAG: circularly permuted type 2 ATP-grasp protein [Sphingomonadaceae bacterium]